MDVEKLVSICRHELRLGEDNDIARLIREVKIIQGHSSGIYTRLSKKHRTNAWEILSGYMLTWKYVEDLDGLGSGQRFWKGETSRLDALIWPKDKKKWSTMTCIQLNILIYTRILVGVAKIFNELQDYSMIDRQKRQSRPTPRNYQEAVSHTMMSSVFTSDTYCPDSRTQNITHLHQSHNQQSHRPQTGAEERISNPRLMSPLWCLYLTMWFLLPKTESSANKPSVRRRRQRKQPARVPTTRIPIQTRSPKSHRLEREH